MIKKHRFDVCREVVDFPGAVDSYIQWIFSKYDDTRDMSMRCFTIEAGGSIPTHSHPWEHVMYVLQGNGEIFSDKENFAVSEGDAIFIPENEQHGYRNTGKNAFVFICIIPNTGDTRNVKI